MIEPLLSLFYPRLCAACGQALVKNEQVICLSCLMDLPYTQFHQLQDNPVAKLFWGRTNIKFATALCHFEKATRVQRLLHQLKYKGNVEVGTILGKELGKQLMESPYFQRADLVLPVPLHPAKEKLRGYNQSVSIAEGVAEIINTRVETKTVSRMKNTATQTKKSRYKRWQNVAEMFCVSDQQELYGKHILLVDDVITTGATLESFAQAVKQAGKVEVSIASIACA